MSYGCRPSSLTGRSSCSARSKTVALETPCRMAVSVGVLIAPSVTMKTL